ncbi:DEAD-boc ATP-dependent (RNA) helicase [Angomonas deanei]|uniref:DEAD/DEAH box helicase/Type III restriction enzyme, res subunit, putative n=1 Tax=Angomonas deanei TaxID=59799 RepID=A0A7G2CK96_9TRYP|nr:DEAD-boc ATP-dependent (RNA) helicase [Angomonas deanei]CAD2219324.1 DEAD/DEAH box helicase/Type III restriction enzyme, res subunit, putative [Angomonas deanei]|eukprot:EPY32621.1 DEAD-boc ATP-dependent (RNA) helicase [Angomonas deanei]
MFRHVSCLSFRYIKSIKPTPTGSAARVIEEYTADTGRRLEGTVPVSQRYFYLPPNTSKEGDDPNYLTDRNRATQMRLGDAKLLVSTEKRHQYMTSSDSHHPLFYSTTSLAGSGLCAQLTHLLREKMHIRQLTELQGALVPLLLKGKHVLAHSETGTGKSFGIALAVMNRILKHNTHGTALSFGGRLHTCIVVPTTELALQYEQWFRFLGGYQQHPSTSAAQLVQIAVEEIPSTEQIHLLYNIQPHVLVGTPDRIHFIYQNSKTIFGGESLRKKIDCLVLDEADLLLAETDNNHNKVSGVALVEKLFRREREEIPAQLVGVSASMDNHTARLLNTFVRNDSVARLTTSFVEQALPTSLNFFFFSIPRAVRAPADHKENEDDALRRVLTPVLRLIAKQYAHPKILLFVEESEHEKGKQVAQTVELLSSLLTEGALPEWAPHLGGSTTFAQPLETFHDKHSQK